MISIEIATTTQAGDIADMSRETFYDTFAEFNTREDMEKYLGHQYTREQLMAQVGAAGHTFLLARCNNELAGYAFLKPNTHKDLGNMQAVEISRFYSRKSFIGKGIGKALMLASIEKAKEWQCRVIWLCVWQQNHRAIEFYQKFGFRKFAETDFLLGNDLQRDDVMQLVIGEAS